MKYYLAQNLGIESECGLFIPVLTRNTPIPCNNTRLMFSTEIDNQEIIHMKIRSGNSWDSNNNELLGAMTFSDLLPSYRGVPFISISFFIKMNDILHVLAENMKTGTVKKFSSKIKLTNKLDENSTSLVDEDYVEKSKINSLAKRMIISSQKSLHSAKNIQTPEKEDVENTITQLKDSLEYENSLETIATLMEKLSCRTLSLHYSILTKHS